MSRILVVEPHKMLQQAFVEALFPEHQVQVSEVIPDTTRDVDIAVIDGAGVRRRELLSAHELEKVHAWKVPLIWIDNEPVANGAPVANAIRLSTPIARDELRAAVAQCVRETPAAQPGAAPKAARAPARATAKIKSADSEPQSAAPKEIIELVDVFDETAELEEGGVARSKN
jgi:hypothetical protein